MNILSKRILAKKSFTTVYHGTDRKSAEDIMKSGVSMDKSSKGYFGRAFYTTPDKSYALSNYAEFSGDADEESDGVVLEFQVSSSANILDLTDAKDWEVWTTKANPGSAFHHRDDFDQRMRKLGFDAIWEDSIDSLVVYNPRVLKLKGAVSG